MLDGTPALAGGADRGGGAPRDGGARGTGTARGGGWRGELGRGLQHVRGRVPAIEELPSDPRGDGAPLGLARGSLVGVVCRARPAE